MNRLALLLIPVLAWALTAAVVQAGSSGAAVASPAKTQEAEGREPGQVVTPTYLRNGVLRYSAEGREIVGRNRPYFNNRPLYCEPRGGEGVVLAGDRPFLRLCATPYGFGGFSAAIVRRQAGKWFQEYCGG